LESSPSCGAPGAGAGVLARPPMWLPLLCMLYSSSPDAPRPPLPAHRGPAASHQGAPPAHRDPAGLSPGPCAPPGRGWRPGSPAPPARRPPCAAESARPAPPRRPRRPAALPAPLPRRPRPVSFACRRREGWWRGV
jgi:hypothetical protein